jgi:hypothetical protein
MVNVVYVIDNSKVEGVVTTVCQQDGKKLQNFGK